MTNTLKNGLGLCLVLVGLIGSSSVVGAPHNNSPSRRSRQAISILSDENISNLPSHTRSRDNNNYRYILSYLPSNSYRQARHGDNELIPAAPSIMKSDKTLLAEEISLGKHNGYYDPFYYFIQESGDSSAGNGRIRRNSHGTHMQMPMYQDSSYEKNPREMAYLYERSNVGSNNVFPNHPAPGPAQAPARRLYRNPNQFLTKQQITAAQSRFNQAQARYYSPSSNFIENREQNYYNNNNNNNNNHGSSYYRSNRNANLDHDIDNGRQDDEAWSIQVGTQLKVNDDGRERNPEQFYVRDETRGGSSHSHNRRYSPYYRS